MGRSTGLVIFVIAVSIGACQPTAAASPVPIDTDEVPSPTARVLAVASQSPIPATTSTPIPPPEATVPPDLQRRVTATRDDIRVTVTLQRNPLPAGELSWVKTKVENIGDTNVTWFHGGCATSVGVGGVVRTDWRVGSVHEGQRQAFKDAALGKDYGESSYDSPFVSFVPRDRLRTGSYGCADVGISEKLSPGASLKATHWWSGLDRATKALPPSGPVTLDIWSNYFWRGKEPDQITDAVTFELTLDAWVSGGSSDSRPSPGEIVDAALGDAAFVEYLETQELHSGREVILWYDAAADAWEVGVMPWYETDPPRIHGVLVDATTGRVTGPLDRAWDEDRDGFPF